MKRIIAMLIVVIFVLFSVSCKKDFSSEDFLGDFILLYGGEGTVYSSQNCLLRKVTFLKNFFLKSTYTKEIFLKTTPYF